VATTRKGTVKFTQFHQPVLESGEYRIKIEQTIESNKTGRRIFSHKRKFAVIGERFGPLPPDEIYAVFPPSESLGQHANVLPHITVKRSTLPWERYPGTRDENRSWLALLLFRDSDFDDEADKPKPKSITVQHLLDDQDNVKFPNLERQLGQQDAEQIAVIDVKRKFVKDILPTRSDLAYLAHVRQMEDVSRRVSGDEFATVICNRLPEPNGISVVHLVSLEERYTDRGEFNYQGAGDEDLIRFVSLANWSFACVDPEQSFTQLLQKLNRTPSTFRLPQSNNRQAEKYLVMGYVPLPHSLREGSQTISWYRSPLIPGANAERYEFPIETADALLRYDSTLGLFDVSYAAAWQLGRLLTLQNQGLAIELFNWKREHGQALKHRQQVQRQAIDFPLRSSRRLNEVRQLRANSPIPQSIQDWFAGLELLKGIPFNYLIADERLFPPESIRFFWVDSLWVDCLQDGALSVGRVTQKDREDDRQIRNLIRKGNQTITGFILRSQIVPGWPGVSIDGYDRIVEDLNSIDPSEANLLPVLRRENLSKDVLICLFAGEVKTVDFYLSPESMHFGLDAPSHDSPEWSKTLRTVNGEPTNTSISPIPWNHAAKEVVNLTQFATQMNQHLNLNDFTSGQFGLQMIEGGQKVRFIAG